MKQDKIIHVPNKVLKRKTKPVKLLTKGKIRRILRMFDVMYAENGVGLAAPQVGWGYSIFIVAMNTKNTKHEMVFINPEILEQSAETIVLQEMCLSVPGIAANVERSKSIVIKAMDLDGSIFTIETDGLLARCIQHEYDHLSGILFTDRADAGR